MTTKQVYQRLPNIILAIYVAIGIIAHTGMNFYLHETTVRWLSLGVIAATGLQVLADQIAQSAG